MKNSNKNKDNEYSLSETINKIDEDLLNKEKSRMSNKFVYSDPDEIEFLTPEEVKRYIKLHKRD